MPKSLEQQMLDALLGIRKLRTKPPLIPELSIRETVALKHIDAIAEQSKRSVAGVSRLQERLHTTMPAVSQMLGVLENKGLIRRDIDPRDRRRIVIVTTEHGQEMLRRVDARATAIAQQLIEHLGEEDAKAYLRLHQKVLAAVEAIQHPSSPEASDKEESH